jgi:UDP-N-acetylglucosamine 3-dehydrogenase
MARADLVVCCDVDPVGAERCPSGVRFTTSYVELLDEPGLEAVFVCTPEHLHREPVEAAFTRGLAVFCEKPIAASLSDADAMIRAERESGRSLVIGHCLRFDPRYVAVKEKVASGGLGRAIHTSTRRNGSFAEGRHLVGRTTLPLYLSVHDLDVLQWILGSRIARVHAEGAAVRMADVGGVDTVVATLRFDDGSVGIHETSWALPDEAGLAFGDHYFSYVGTLGCAYIEIRAQNVTIYGGGEEASAAKGAAPAWVSGARGLVEYPETTYMPEAFGVPSGIYMAELEHFLIGVRSGTPSAIRSEEARSALAAALALEESLARGGPVDVAAVAPSRGSTR